MLEQLICCGVETAIGFNEVTTVIGCNRYAAFITELICEDGKSIGEAVEYARNQTYYDEPADKAVIGGDLQKRYAS